MQNINSILYLTKLLEEYYKQDATNKISLLNT